MESAVVGDEVDYCETIEMSGKNGEKNVKQEVITPSKLCIHLMTSSPSSTSLASTVSDIERRCFRESWVRGGDGSRGGERRAV